jgi:drug/metabolite transporter (DMT)-like permease
VTARSAWFYHLMAILTIVIWSFSYLHIIWLAERVTPLRLTLLRYDFFAPAVAGLLLWRRPRLRGLRARQWWLILAIAIASGPGYYLPLSWGADDGRISASLMGLIIATVPIHVGWMAWLALGEKPTWRRAVGLILGIGGLAIVILSGSKSNGLSASGLAGPLAVMFCALVAALNTVLVRASRTTLGPLDLVAVSGAIGVVMCLAIHPWAGMNQVAEMPWSGWWQSFYLGFVAIGVGYVTWFAAVSGLPAGSVALYLFVPSVLSALWAWLWQGNQIGWPYVIGSLLVMVGLVIGVRRTRAEARTPATGESAPAASMPRVAGSA